MKRIFWHMLMFVSLFEDYVFAQQMPTRVICPNIAIRNGKVRRRQRGRFIKFICNTGYMLAGERHSVCVHGEWSPSPPKCVRPTCNSKVQPPADGLIYPTHSGAALHFFCKSGFLLKGPSHIYCDGRYWDNNSPICLPEGKKPELSCNFETEDLCGWTHDLNHDFEWRRENYNTPSGAIGTGPSHDHTKGVGKDGYYMYIESSSRNENDTARLISPVYEKMEGEVCFEFFYHMFGATTGSLKAYVKKVPESWYLDRSKEFFSMSGNQGDRWYRAFHRLGIIDNEFQIIIEGIRGPGYVSDIAIDDVRLIPNCTVEDADIDSTTTMEETTLTTEIIQTVDTCEGRCGTKELVTKDRYHLSCDCDSTCYENNRCCPDYVDHCILDTTERNDITTTEVATEEPTETKKESETVKVTALTVQYVTMKEYPTSPTVHTTTVQPTTEKQIFLRPVVKLETPPPKTEILRKTVPTKATTPKPTTSEATSTTKEDSNDINDVMDVFPPYPKAVSAPPDDDTSKEFWSDEEELNVDAPASKNFSETDKLRASTQPMKIHFSIALIGISVLAVIVLTSIVAVVVVRRYRSSRTRMNFSNNGDSQSDVRYLAGSDMLDLSLEKMYDEL